MTLCGQASDLTPVSGYSGEDAKRGSSDLEASRIATHRTSTSTRRVRKEQEAADLRKMTLCARLFVCLLDLTAPLFV